LLTLCPKIHKALGRLIQAHKPSREQGGEVDWGGHNPHRESPVPTACPMDINPVNTIGLFQKGWKSGMVTIM
jgi:hypothetical protein